MKRLKKRKGKVRMRRGKKAASDRGGKEEGFTCEVHIIINHASRYT